MNQETFSKQNEDTWLQLDTLILMLEKGKSLESKDASHFPHLYRLVCKHLALVRERNYSTALHDRLQSMVLKGHQVFYRQRRFGLDSLVNWALVDFPAAVRRESRTFWLANLCFYGPFILCFVLTMADPNFVHNFLSYWMLENMETMYDPANGVSRSFEENFRMFGFYIYNNTSIGFRTFASGFFCGIGTVFALVYNGGYFGLVFAHLIHEESIDPFVNFVSGHAAMELTAIVLAGQCGLKIGFAILTPGDRTRSLAVRDATTKIMPIIYGFAVMFFLAAAIEGFWSANNFPTSIKLTFGGAMALLIALYFMYCGRRHEH